MDAIRKKKKVLAIPGGVGRQPMMAKHPREITSGRAQSRVNALFQGEVNTTLMYGDRGPGGRTGN